MKKNLLFAAMAVTALASCSNDDVVDVNNGGGISFRASLDRAVTRTNVTSLQNLAAFNVTAIGDGKNYFTDLGVSSPDNGVTGQPLPLTTGWVMSLPSSPMLPKVPPAQ